MKKKLTVLDSIVFTPKCFAQVKSLSNEEVATLFYFLSLHPSVKLIKKLNFLAFFFLIIFLFFKYYQIEIKVIRK